VPFACACKYNIIIESRGGGAVCDDKERRVSRPIRSFREDPRFRPAVRDSFSRDIADHAKRGRN